MMGVKVAETLVCICAVQFSEERRNDGSQIGAETLFAQVNSYGSQELKNACSLRKNEKKKLKSTRFYKPAQ